MLNKARLYYLSFFLIGLFSVFPACIYGFQEIQLTNDPYNHTSAQWSSDGAWIVYVKNQAGKDQIYKISADGGSEIQLTSTSYQHRSPSWSPDGQWIAYSRTESGDTASQIYKISASGGGEVALTSGGRAGIEDRFYPRWSADGTQISYHKGPTYFEKEKKKANPEYHLQIYKISSNGGFEIALTSDNYDHWGAEWSPDGNWLVYTKTDRSYYERIYKIPSAGGSEIRLTNGNYDYQSPQWSPDGNWIAYAKWDQSSHSQIYKMPASGGTEQRLTGTNYDRYDPQWSPDGSWITYWEIDKTGQAQIYKTRSWPIKEAYLTFDNYWHAGPQWSPDNKWIVYEKDDQSGYFQIYKVQSILRLPLGKTIYNAGDVTTGEDWFMVYIPDKYGGTLDVTVTGNHQRELFYDRGSLGEPPYQVPQDKFGWYYIKVSGEESQYDLTTSFIQIGDATQGSNAWGWKPWNGWYWPTRDFSELLRPSLYVLTGNYTPLLNYDQVYGTTSRDWEAQNHSGGEVWEGHCWGWSLASIAREQPLETTYNEIYFNQDEMEGLYSELADGDFAFQTDPPVDNLPPRGSGLDVWPGRFQKVLAKYILIGTETYSNKQEPLQSNLRATNTQFDSDPLEIWNHVIYNYSSEMKEIEGRDNELNIEMKTTVNANMDFENGSIPSDDAYREESYVYQVIYLLNGAIDIDAPEQKWISSTNYAPKNFYEVRVGSMQWQSPSGITKGNVDTLYNQIIKSQNYLKGGK